MFKKLLWRSGALGLLCTLVALSTPMLAQSTSFTITAGVDNDVQGSILPSDIVRVGAGGSQTFLVFPNSGYRVADLRVDGTSQGPLTSFTFTNVSANHTIFASFSAVTYTVNATSGPNGTLSPNSLLEFQYGDNQTFSITPDPGYEIADVVVDGSSQGPVSSYTFATIDRDHTIAVSFAALSPGTGAGGGPASPGKSVTPPSVRAAAPSATSPFNWSGLLGLIAGITAVVAMITALILRIHERRAGPRSWAPAFTVEDLEISPKELPLGNMATVAVTVNNRGDHAGTFKVTLKIDGITKGMKDVTLARGTSDRVEFSIPVAAPGSFSVNVGDLSGTLTVVEA